MKKLYKVALAAGTVKAVSGGVWAYVKCVRPWQMHWGATEEEAARQLPYDEIVADPTWNATRALTVRARPGQIWPFLVQIGWGRAGWYGYDLVDNGGRPSTWDVLPEHQHLEVGTEFPMSPYTAMVCADFEENRWMLWRGKGAGVSAGTWVWYLDPIDDFHTRLITRMRDHYDWRKPFIAVQIATELGDLPFMRKCMLGVKERAERLAALQANPEPGESAGATDGAAGETAESAGVPADRT